MVPSAGIWSDMVAGFDDLFYGQVGKSWNEIIAAISNVAACIFCHVAEHLFLQGQPDFLPQQPRRFPMVRIFLLLVDRSLPGRGHHQPISLLKSC